MPQDALVDAIMRRVPVFLRYRGGETRVVQPHVLYRSATGKLLLDAYQVAGPSASGRLPGWREFDLTELEEFEPLGDETFPLAPGFDPAAAKYGGTRRAVAA